jgi:hypothetical protein
MDHEGILRKHQQILDSATGMFVTLREIILEDFGPVEMEAAGESVGTHP